MKDLLTLSRFALRLPGVSENTSTAGCFEFPTREPKLRLRVIASAGYLGWDHVSVSTRKRCPTWNEMCRIKDLFWETDETVMQLHVPAEDHICNHPHCLHLWRPTHCGIPRPPAELVGVKGMPPEVAKSLTVEERHAIQDEQMRALAKRLGVPGLGI